MEGMSRVAAKVPSGLRAMGAVEAEAKPSTPQWRATADAPSRGPPAGLYVTVARPPGAGKGGDTRTRRSAETVNASNTCGLVAGLWSERQAWKVAVRLEMAAVT